MDAETFKKVCLPFSRSFYIVAYRLLENSQDAEDVVQDVFEKLWKLRNSLRQIENIEAYGVTITRNLALDKMRSAEHRAIKCEPENALKYETDESEKSAERKSRVQKIKSLIPELPEKQQKVFYLRYFNDCSPQEIGKITGIGAGNIRVLLMRARQTIRERMQKTEYYE